MYVGRYIPTYVLYVLHYVSTYTGSVFVLDYAKADAGKLEKRFT